MDYIDWDKLADRATQAIERLNVRYADLRLERIDATAVHFSGDRLETAGRTFDAGGLARVLLDGGGWGIASFNSFDELEERLSAARDCAAVQASDDGPLRLADVQTVIDRVEHQPQEDFREIPLADKVERMRDYNSRLLEADSRIADTDVAYGDRFIEKLLVTSEGTRIRQTLPYCQVAVMAAARSGDNIQRAFETAGDTRRGYRIARDIDDQVDVVARRAIGLLDAPRVDSGRYPVVLDPKLAGVFIHEAFGHLSEADHVCENPQAREMMVLGRRFAPEFFSVYDDATIDGLWGSHRYDDEGVLTRPVPLIRNGELTGRLHSRFTAASMDEPPTGNAHALNYQHAPIVRMSNTYIAPGKQGLDDLLAPIKLGVYACGMFGGQTMLENFSFSAAHARMIRDGKLAEPVRDVVLSGNLFQTLGDVSGLGDDLQMFSGGCGKGGQSPKPVALGSPHLRIDNVLIGGN